MTPQDRWTYQLNADKWDHQDKQGENLKNHLISIIEDWGICLDLTAYREALLHFTSGPDTGLLPIEIKSRGQIIGSQKLCLLSLESAWHISAVKSNPAPYETHLRRLLSHTNLKSLYWINLHKKDIHLRTIQISSPKK